MTGPGPYLLRITGVGVMWVGESEGVGVLLGVTVCVLVGCNVGVSVRSGAGNAVDGKVLSIFCDANLPTPAMDTHASIMVRETITRKGINARGRLFKVAPNVYIIIALVDIAFRKTRFSTFCSSINFRIRSVVGMGVICAGVGRNPVEKCRR